VQEGSAKGTLALSEDLSISSLSATDEDVNSLTSEWAQLSWSITAGNSLGVWQIDATSGEISLVKPDRIDFEDNNVNYFQVTATVCDAGVPSMCDSAPVEIFITNRNEPPTLDDAERSVSETTRRSLKLSPAQAIGKVLVASDPDGPEAESLLSFSIVGGDPMG